MGVKLRIKKVASFGSSILKAIKGLKEITGWGLKECKDFIDQLDKDGVEHTPLFEVKSLMTDYGGNPFDYREYLEGGNYTIIDIESREYKIVKTTSKFIIYDIRGFAYYVIDGDYEIEDNIISINITDGHRGIITDDLENSSLPEDFDVSIVNHVIKLPFMSVIIDEQFS